jgi:hypothetical protein
MMPQEFGLIPPKTLRENVNFMGKNIFDKGKAFSGDQIIPYLKSI